MASGSQNMTTYLAKGLEKVLTTNATNTDSLLYINTADTNITADMLGATTSIAFTRMSTTGAYTTGHIVWLNAADIGTPFQLVVHDSSDLYLYKRWKSSGTWTDWVKMRAGTADTWTTARTLTIGNTGKAVDGSANVSWSKDEILGASTNAYFLRGDKEWSNTLNGAFTANGTITANGGYLKSTANSNTVTIGSQNTSFTHIYSSANIPFIFNNTIETTTGDLGSTSYPWNNLYIGKSDGAGIYYTTNNYTKKIIEFFNHSADQYGVGLKICTGGCIIIGAGESGDTIKSNVNPASGTEALYLASDNSIYFYPGQNSYDASATIEMTASRIFAGVEGDTTREAEIVCRSGAGILYLASQASTTGTRGLYTPAHGTGSSRWAISIDTNNVVSFNGNASTATTWQTARTLTIGNKGQSVNGSANVSWSLNDILYNATTIGTDTSWDQTGPSIYYVASGTAFTGTNHPGNNSEQAPYTYGQLIVSRAGSGGVLQVYASHHASGGGITHGLRYRTGWNSGSWDTWSTLLDDRLWRKYIFANKNIGRSSLTVTDSTWAVTSGTDVFGLSFKDSGLKYTPSGGSATASTDSGDWRAWLTCASTSNTVELNMRIDGSWQASKFIGPLQGNADTATKATQDGSGNVITSKYVTVDTAQTITGTKSWGASGAGGQLNGAATDGGINSIRVGNDVWLGDCNTGGIMGMKSTGTNCGFYMYNSSGTQIGQLYFNGTNLYCNKTIEHPDEAVSYIAGAKGTGAALYAKKAYNADHWYPAVALETKGGGAWQIGNYNDETLEFQYATKANRDANTNTTSEIYMQQGDTGRVVTSGNYTNWTVTKTGSGASGSWGISVTGSSASCTGNSATTSKLSDSAHSWTATEVYNYMMDRVLKAGDTMTGSIKQKMTSVTRGSSPSANQYRTYEWIDNGNKRVAQVEYGMLTSGESRLHLYVLGNNTTSTGDEYGGIIIYKKVGVSGNASATYNANDGTFSATTFSGALSGNASTATKLSNTPSNTTTFLRGDNTWTSTINNTIICIPPTTNMASNNMAFNGGIQVRENGGVGNGQSAIEYGPRISFHWGNRVAKSITLHSNGTFYFRDQNGTTRSTIDANVVGALTGNVTGNCSGSSGSCTGNAAGLTGGLVTNTVTSHGNLAVTTAKGSYYGINLGHNASGMSIMSINASHQGLYNQTNGQWILYYNAASTSKSIVLGNSTVNVTGGISLNLNTKVTGTLTISSHCYFANGTTYYINSSGTGNLNALTVNATTASSSTSTGALIVKGGIGAAGKIYGSQVHNAVWNDYAECRQVETEEPGRCMYETNNGIMKLTEGRLQAGCKLTSDTFGTCMGETELARTPIAVAGRVLAYTYQNRNNYPLGAAVCSAPNGTIDLMTRDEIMMYPERIVGTVSEIPDYEIWHGGSKELPEDIEVKGRIWIYVK